MENYIDTKQLLNQEIYIEATDADNRQSIRCHFTHTRHSSLRAAQRGISSDKIETALHYGNTIYKQGLIYFILGEDNIPDDLRKDKNKLKNIVVIVAGDSNQVITCYRSSNPFRNIKHKSKTLHVHGVAA